jgi:hypothetical protein
LKAHDEEAADDTMSEAPSLIARIRKKLDDFVDEITTE